MENQTVPTEHSPIKVPFKKLRFAVVGATGAVGRNLLSVLHDEGIPAQQVVPIASGNSRHTTISYGEDDEIKLHKLDGFEFSNIDIAFFAIDAALAKVYVPIATQHGALVIDKSSHYRQDSEVPLIVPEVNPQDLSYTDKKYIISNPNCSTIPMVAALKPIHDINPIKRIVVSTYQSVSGAGKIAMDLLFNETKAVLMNQVAHENDVFTKPISFNVIPHIDDFLDSGDTKEEMKMVLETKKILDQDIAVHATCVRVPVFIGHSLSLNIELTKNLDLKAIQKALKHAPGLQFTIHEDEYITPIEAAQEDAIYVCRLRQDTSVPSGIALWVVTDNMRKGAALNGVQIAKLVCKSFAHLIRNFKQ